MTDKAIEIKAVNDEHPADQADYDDLAAAYDLESAESDVADDEEPKPEVSEEEEAGTEEKVLTDEEQEQQDRSRFGRIIKRALDPLKTELTDSLRQNEILTAEINQLKGMLLANSQETEDPLDPEDMATVGNVQKLIDRAMERLEEERAKNEQMIDNYEKEYMNLLARKADEDPDLFEEISELITGDTPFNKVHVKGYTSPGVDLEINYNKAKAHILSQSREKDKPKLKGDRAKGTKVGESDKVKTDKQAKSVDLNSLDRESREFLEGVKRRGGDPQGTADKALGEKR